MEQRQGNTAQGNPTQAQRPMEQKPGNQESMKPGSMRPEPVGNGKQRHMQGEGVEAQNPRGMERFILIFYSLFSINIVIWSITGEAPVWVPVSIMLSLFAAWSVNMGNVRDFVFRALFISGCMQLTAVLYAVNKDNLISVSAIIISFAIFTGMFGVLDACRIYAWGTAFIFLYFFTTRLSTVGLKAELADSVALSQVFSIVAAEFVIYIWVKKRAVTADQMSKVISSLRMAEHSKNDFLANISHEIRTPVNTIYGMSELLTQETDMQDIKNKVYDIQTASRGLMSVVSDIMDFTDLQFGNMDLENEEYNLASTMNDIVNMSVAMKKDKHVELIINCDADMPRLLYGDEKKIRRVLMNLVSNAVKFTNEGCIAIDLGMRKEAYGINLILKVRDTGIGMREEDLEKIFTSFNQVDTKRNRQEGGVGLGMAISKIIVEKMNGVISVKSRIGQGTSVTAVIPQKVVDERPIIHIENPDQINMLIYISMEQFELTAIRDEYFSNIRNMLSQLEVEGHICRNLNELKRRVEGEKPTHIFIGRVDYLEDPAYFNDLSEKTKVVMLIDHWEEKFIERDTIIRLFKPFYLLPIVSVLNNEMIVQKPDQKTKKGKFVAPDVHVLVVDDNVMNIKVVQGLLANYKIHVTAATSGKEALEKIESKDYDFVFMDHMMPEMDGVETLHKIRAKAGSYYHRVPIIALTANAIAGIRASFLAEGFADFVEKPVESSVLERVLRRNLPEEKLLPLDEAPSIEEASADKKDAENGSADLSGNSPQVAGDGFTAEGIPADFKVGDLDIQKGLIYCGGMAQYLEILKLYSDSGPKNLENVEMLFGKEDWKNYTIAVHAVKSSMLSIGAIKLSDLAKDLEAAGKAVNISYIKEHHQEMIEEYQRVIGLLKDFRSDQDEDEEEEESAEDLPEIYDVEFERLVAEMEDAMYGFDEEEMLRILDELQKYKYRGKALKGKLAPIRRKVENSDYMSAVESLTKLKEDLKNAEGGEADV